MNYFFEWDPNKNNLNQQKHKISFERATSVFKDPQALTIFDTEHSIREDRWITLGSDETGTLFIVCHTYKEETKNSYRIRIISARKAVKKEIEQYKEMIQ